jgi:hypothetical protein
MGFTMPGVEIVRDSAGKSCLRAGDALKIAQALAAANGLSPELIHRARIEAVEKDRLHTIGKKNPDGATFQELIGGEPPAYPADVPLDGTDVTLHVSDADSVLILGPRKNAGVGYQYGQGL